MADEHLGFLNGPVSDAELRRRLQRLREAMERDGVDVLVLQGDSDDLGGYVRYVLDLPAGGYGTTVIVPRDDELTVVMHGGFDDDLELAGRNPMLRGAKRLLSYPYFPTASYTAEAPGRLALKGLTPYARGTVGLVGAARMGSLFTTQLREGLPHASIVDASDLVDLVKAIKSPEEQNLLRECARIQDEALAAGLASVRPGVRQSDVAEAVRRVCVAHGAEAGIVMVGSGPPGGGWALAPRHAQNRVIAPADMVAILVEMNGPGGLFAELGRSAILGDVPAAVAHEYELAIEAQQFTLDRLVPGTSFAAVWHDYSTFLEKHQRPAERRIHCHGQGVDLVERPLVRFDEPMTVEAGMNLTCHPTWLHEGIFSWTCDNYLIGEHGAGASLHQTPAGLTTLS